MKFIKLIIAFFMVSLASHCFAAEESSKITALSEVSPIKELKIEGLNFAHLSQGSKVGELSEIVKDPLSMKSFCLQAIKRADILHPSQQGLAYINGILCHVANYPRSMVYTIFEGPQYGLQVVTDYKGCVLYVNGEFTIEHQINGVILRHYYTDSEVVTGGNQVIFFY